MTELKPCPFCGGEAEVGQVAHGSGMDDHFINWFIRCQKCGANIERAADDFYGREFFSAGEVMELWNRRDNNGD